MWVEYESALRASGERCAHWIAARARIDIETARRQGGVGLNPPTEQQRLATNQVRRCAEALPLTTDDEEVARIVERLPEQIRSCREARQQEEEAFVAAVGASRAEYVTARGEELCVDIETNSYWYFSVQPNTPEAVVRGQACRARYLPRVRAREAACRGVPTF